MDENQSMCQTTSDYPMMSESEAQEMIKIYNETVAQMQRDNHSLQVKLDQSKTLWNEANEKNEKAVAKLSVEQEREIDLEFKLEELNTKIAQLISDPILKPYAKQLEDLFKLQTQSIEQEQDIIQFEEPVGEQVIIDIIDKIKEMEQIRRSFSTPKICIKCRQSYNPKVNPMDSCLFHPGKLKFYSCKKCGADEYFTCCLRCSKCSDGCRTGVHTPKQ